MIAAGDGDPRHGTANGYAHHRCRCDLCRAAWADYNRVYHRAWYHRQGRPTRADYLASIGQQPGGTHGRIATYQNGCHCDQCRAVSAERRRHYRTRAKEDTR